MKRILLIMALVWLVSGCAPDPRKEAKAFQIRSQAEQEAANSEAARAHQQELNAIETQNRQIEEQHREATAAEWRAGLNTVIHYGLLTFAVVLCFVLVMVSRSFSNSFATVTEGVAKALVRRAEVRANLIRLDPETRQYPVYLERLGNGRYSAVNFNTSEVLLLDVRKEPDRQMIAAMGAVQYAGALAQEARQSNDPTGVAMINAPVIDAKSELLSIGRDLVRHE